MVTAGNIPDQITIDLGDKEIGDVISISGVELPEGSRPVITDRDFVIANVAAPTVAAASEEDEDAEAEDGAEDSGDAPAEDGGDAAEGGEE